MKLSDAPGAEDDEDVDVNIADAWTRACAEAVAEAIALSFLMGTFFGIARADKGRWVLNEAWVGKNTGLLQQKGGTEEGVIFSRRKKRGAEAKFHTSLWRY